MVDGQNVHMKREEEQHQKRNGRSQKSMNIISYMREQSKHIDR